MVDVDQVQPRPLNHRVMSVVVALEGVAQRRVVREGFRLHRPEVDLAGYLASVAIDPAAVAEAVQAAPEVS